MAKLNVQKILSLAKSYENRGELDKARQQYESVLSAYPKNVQAQKARLRLTAKRHVDQKFSAQPSRLDELIALYDQGKFSEVIRIGEKFAEESPYPEQKVMYDAVYEEENYNFISHKLT